MQLPRPLPTAHCLHWGVGRYWLCGGVVVVVLSRANWHLHSNWHNVGRKPIAKANVPQMWRSAAAAAAVRATLLLLLLWLDFVIVVSTCGNPSDRQTAPTERTSQTDFDYARALWARGICLPFVSLAMQVFFRFFFIHFFIVQISGWSDSRRSLYSRHHWIS